MNVGLQSTANTIPSLVNTVSQNRADINQASKLGDPVIHISNPNSQNGSDDTKLTQHVEVGAVKAEHHNVRRHGRPPIIVCIDAFFSHNSV